MNRFIFSFIFLFFCSLQISSGQTVSTEKIDKLLPMRGLAIQAPSVRGMDLFLKFVE
jgi:hypothetical protein